MILSAINHSYNPVQQSVIDKNTLELRIETARDDISRVVLLYGPRYSENENPSNSKKTQITVSDSRKRHLFN